MSFVEFYLKCEQVATFLPLAGCGDHAAITFQPASSKQSSYLRSYPLTYISPSPLSFIPFTGLSAATRKVAGAAGAYKKK
jgi:hypothetical protein